ncbi:tetratricopeptide repeat 12 [Brachionus plicatilis]|uniref:Tetratricopeptide repeat 12 n=1 Tax=Brachionus plicatilis TaxID=10195 RepID=A0A3M7QID0_BRAPC|nr:tetratricopeptide repeat 12 [Brachionus plicatilis]
MDIPSGQELDDFLKKVDQVESIVKALNSDNQNLVKENLDKADELIQEQVIEVDGIKTKTSCSRSVINKYSENEEKTPTLPQPNLNQETFMAALEKDAQERFERKKKMTILANELKEIGNKEFKKKNYEKAIEYYTEALQKVRDIPVIYTNRAQAFNAIGKYEEAISDCDWALRIDDKCIKALIHKGKAFGFMKKFDQALTEFENAKIIDSKQNVVIDEYIKELERSRIAFSQEKSAEIFLDQNNDKNSPASNIMEILNNKINLANQNNWYYSGGLRCLASLCNDETTRTLFRTQNGFSLFEKHSVFSKYFNSEIELLKLNGSEIDILSSSFEFFTAITRECDENIRAIFKIENFSQIIENLLKQLKENSLSVKSQLVDFLFSLSEKEFGVIQIINNFNQFKILDLLIDLVENKNDSMVDSKTVNIVQNLLLEEK